MILTCPACSTRYLVGAAAIGAEGRMVRCAKCGHTWHVDGVASTDSAAPPPASETSPPETDTRPSVSDHPDAAAESVRDDDIDGAPRDISPEEGAPAAAAESLPQRLRPIPRGSGLPALPGEPRRPLPIGWIVLVLVTIGVVAALAVGRDAIVAAWPPANRLYASFGYPADIPGMGLEFRNIVSVRTEENGRPVLVVHGYIANIMNVERSIPRINVALKDEAERRVQEWSFKADAATVGPGESLPFETRIADPSERARGLTIEFVASP